MTAVNICQLAHPTLESRLTGVLDETRTVAGYRGIPYASVEKRWARSKPYTELGAEFDARKFG